MQPEVREAVADRAIKRTVTPSLWYLVDGQNRVAARTSRPCCISTASLPIPTFEDRARQQFLKFRNLPGRSYEALEGPVPSRPNARFSAVSRMFDDDASVTRLYLELREGREEAATDLWQLCCRALVREARKQLGPNERRASDEEDVALAVFHELCQGVSDGRLSDDLRREDLTKLLRHFTRQETLDQRRHSQRTKRGGGIVRGDSVFAMNGEGRHSNVGFQSVPSPEPSPELMVQLDDQLQRLMSSLADDRLRDVARSVLAGDSRAETAEKLGLSLRSIERKVSLIRDAWKSQLEAD